MAQRLSDSSVKALEAPAKGNAITYDTEVKGFGLRVTARGVKAFVLNYRTNSGLERRYTIGRFPDWKTATAREEAKRLKQQIRVNGADPVGDLESERSAPTMVDLAARYLEEHAPKKRSQADDKRIFDKLVLPELRAKKVAEVTFTDIDRLHRKITKSNGPYRANRVVATLSKAFSLAIRWKWRTDNPCKGVERNQEIPRVRYLSADEHARLGNALYMLHDQDAAIAIHLLMYTGARSGEVLSATWDQFDLKSTPPIWTKPSHHTKQKQTHRVPLSGAACGLLIQLETLATSPYLFPGQKGNAHRRDLKKPWAAICKAAKLKNLRLHDLRHNYASQLASDGHSLHLIGGLLGHTRAETTMKYAHLLDESLKKATDSAGTIITGKLAKVIPIKKHG
jgi:integrase